MRGMVLGLHGATPWLGKHHRKTLNTVPAWHPGGSVLAPEKRGPHPEVLPW